MKYYIGAFIFFFIFATCFLIARANANNNQKLEREKKNFWAKESKANSTRKQDISKLEYLTIPLEKLPLEKAISLGAKNEVEALERLATEKIINLSMYSNTDLKLMYGPANLDALTEYDTNYTSLIRLLDQIAKVFLPEVPVDAKKSDILLAYKQCDTLENAKQILEYAIAIDSDITSSYVNLGRIYQATDKVYLFSQLQSRANNISSLSGKTIVKKLSNL